MLLFWIDKIISGRRKDARNNYLNTSRRIIVKEVRHDNENVLCTTICEICYV